MLISPKTMSNHEIEKFLTELLQKVGFIVSETPISSYNGIGLIALSNEHFYKGK